MKKILLIAALFVLGCVPQEEKISDAEVIKTVEQFYDAMNPTIEKKRPDFLNEYVTDDFICQWEGRRNEEEFTERLSAYTHLSEVTWRLSDYRIVSDVNYAHASFLAKGQWISQIDSTRLMIRSDNLISVLIVKEEGNLKIDFYSNDRIKFESNKIN